MDKMEFCDNYCPIPARWVEFPKVDNELTIDCDMEESECPFKDVDFSKVTKNTIDERLSGWLSPEQVKEYRKAIFDELDKYYVPQSLNEYQLKVYNQLKDGEQSGFIKLNNTGSISFYGKNTEKCSFDAKMFWQALKEETERGK